MTARSRWKIQREGDVAILSFDDGKANAMLTQEFRELEEKLDVIEASDARAVVFTGRAGVFSAGLNLKILGTLSLEEKEQLGLAMGEAALRLFLFPKPVIAAVSGHALGAGAILALASDVRIFADGPFKFGLNEVAIGLFVPSFGVELARATVSQSRLTELVIHGRVLSPMECLSMHIAGAVHAPESLLAAALMRARELVPLSGAGYALTKRIVREPFATVARRHMPGEVAEFARMLDARK
jgi:enoyl-CoA hydratase